LEGSVLGAAASAAAAAAQEAQEAAASAAAAAAAAAACFSLRAPRRIVAATKHKRARWSTSQGMRRCFFSACG